jgi:alkyldihydroxyacetonephosphate synthase
MREASFDADLARHTRGRMKQHEPTAAAPDERCNALEPPGYPVQSSTIAACQRQATAPAWLAALRTIVGDANVLLDTASLWAYCRDRSPYAIFHVRNSRVPATLPTAVACPGSVGELADVVRLSRQQGIPVLPFGAGSGVVGGALPVARELVIDLKRLNRLVDLNEVDGTATVQAGMNGGQFEAALNARGYTCQHLPQSLHMSTVGGWAACRSAGQSSTRYGKIEDMVLGLEVVLPDGTLFKVRPAARRAVGPGVQELFIGSEGVFGIISELTLRVWRLPEARHGVVIAFSGLEAGLAAFREIMQSELRPAVARLYDAEESHQRTGGDAPFRERPILAILEFCGPARLAALERDLALAICAAAGGLQTDDNLYRNWLQHRYTSYSTPWHARDYFNDTIEITARWSALPGMIQSMREAVRRVAPDAYFSMHWSHFYTDGACQYMTLRLPPMPDEPALRTMRALWDAVTHECHRLGGSMSHHHGVGLFRAPWMKAEHGAAGFDLLRALKHHLDPQSLFLPGKLGLSPVPGADTVAGVAP